MRYYELTITPKDSESPADEKHRLQTSVAGKATGKTGKVRKWSSLNKDGTTNLNALQIDVDIPVVQMANPMGQATIKLYGIELSDIKQATDFNGATVELSLGMSKGLPLANPDQRGVVVIGTVYQAFGNWQGEQMTLDFIVMPTATFNNNYTFSWKKGQPMKTMIEQVLKRNHPEFTLKFNIKDNLILSADETGAYFTLVQFAEYVNRASKSIITDPEYQGVNISIRGNTFVVEDGTSKAKPKKISFVDMIGQPQWMNIAEVQFKTAMRADIHVGDFVELPESAVKTSSKSMQGFKKDDVAFKGEFRINAVRHVGSSRQPDANSWCTVFTCLVVQ